MFRKIAENELDSLFWHRFGLLTHVKVELIVLECTEPHPTNNVVDS